MFHFLQIRRVFVSHSQKSAGPLKWISSDIQWPQTETATVILGCNTLGWIYDYLHVS